MKGNKLGHIGKVASFFVVISFGKGICYCKYYDKLSGKLFADFIETAFLRLSKVTAIEGSKSLQSR